MAKAEIVQTMSVMLTLTEEEAVYLQFLVGNCVIGGGRYREVNDGIYRALSEHFDVVQVKVTGQPYSGLIQPIDVGRLGRLVDVGRWADGDG